MGGIILEAKKRKDQIMHTAIDLFTKRGYENVSTNDIIKELGISRGALYHHFSSKESILESAVTQILTEELKRARNIFQNNTLKVIDKIPLSISYDSTSNPLYLQLTQMLHRDNPTLLITLLKKKLEILLPVFEDLIKEGNEEGIFSCDLTREAAQVIVLLSTFLFTNSVFTLNNSQVKNMAKIMQQTLEAILKTQEGIFDFMYDTIILESKNFKVGEQKNE